MRWRVSLQASGVPPAGGLNDYLNFNLDAIFRVYVRRRYGRPPLVRTIERASKQREFGRINLYHMHGYLRFGPKSGNSRDEASDKLVFTEQEYYDFFSNQ